MDNPKSANSQVKPVLTASIPLGVLVLLLLYRSHASWYLLALAALASAGLIGYCAVWARRRASDQLGVLANLLEAVIEGDYSLRGKTVYGEAVYNQIVSHINQLADALSLRNVENREHELLLGKITHQIDVGILLVDEDQRITLANPAASRLMGRKIQQIQGMTLAQLHLQALIESGEKRVLELEFNGMRSHYYVYSDRFMEGGERRNLLFITDVQRILRAEERKAWQSLLRVLSHEINNSLSPIGSISDTLARILRRDEAWDKAALLDGLSVIKERSQSLAAFIERYRQFARLPKPEKRMFGLKNMFEGIVPLFPNRRILLENKDETMVEADPDQIQQMFVNLLKNADEAMADKEGVVTIAWRKVGGYIQLDIQDEGVGLAGDENLFVPFYTTKAGGSGIGLVLCRQIAFNHHGEIALKNRSDGKGVVVTVLLGG